MQYDYVIVGGGCMGASIAWHLAKRNAGSIALLEREKFLGQESTGKCAGGVRAQFSTEVNTRLSLLSIDRFEHFSDEVDHPLQYLQWGYLFLLGNDEQVARARKQREMWTRLGMHVEWLEPAHIEKRFSYLNMDGIVAATFHQRDGFVDPNDIVQGYASAARRRGMVEMTECEVLDLVMDRSNRQVHAVKTNRGDITVGKALILCTGAWTRKLAMQMMVDVPIDPYRRQILVTKRFDQIATPFPMTVDLTTGLYFHPESGGVLIGLSDLSEAPSFNQSLNEAFSETMLMTAMERCPLLGEAAINRGWAGLYEVTPDHHPILGRAGVVENTFICAGFSGHGLMHAPAAGIVMSEMILDGKAHSVDVSELSLSRFSDPARLRHETAVI